MSDRPSGMEIMVRSLMKATGADPDEVFGMIKHLIDSGALGKIIQFADDLPKIVEALENVAERLAAIERRLGADNSRVARDDPGTSDGRSGDALPRPLYNGADAQDLRSSACNIGVDV